MVSLSKLALILHQKLWEPESPITNSSGNYFFPEFSLLNFPDLLPLRFSRWGEQHGI